MILLIGTSDGTGQFVFQQRVFRKGILDIDTSVTMLRESGTSFRDHLLPGDVNDFGSIGDTDITRAQISLGRAINQTTEWTVGYDYLDIGGVTVGSAFTGLRFRF